MTTLPAELAAKIDDLAAFHAEHVDDEIHVYYRQMLASAREDAPGARDRLDATIESEVSMAAEPSSIARRAGDLGDVDANTVWTAWHAATVAAVMVRLGLIAGTDEDADEAEAGWHDPEPAGASQNATENASESRTGQFIPAPLF